MDPDARARIDETTAQIAHQTSATLHGGYLRAGCGVLEQVTGGYLSAAVDLSGRAMPDRSRTVMSSASLAVSNSSAARASTTGGLSAASAPEPRLALFGDWATSARVRNGR